MKQEERNLPLSTVAMVFGGLSIPLAFAIHLVSLAFVLGVLALAFGLWGDRTRSAHLLRYTQASVGRARKGWKMGAIGMGCSVVMWILWSSNALL
ncbi:MAG: hypothetical protein JNJ91_11555 [Flavobacteriales bacterium]|nr:hypothetical protein [Flavobacteriales bacterium]